MFTGAAGGSMGILRKKLLSVVCIVSFPKKLVLCNDKDLQD